MSAFTIFLKLTSLNGFNPHFTDLYAGISTEHFSQSIVQKVMRSIALSAVDCRSAFEAVFGARKALVRVFVIVFSSVGAISWVITGSQCFNIHLIKF